MNNVHIGSVELLCFFFPFELIALLFCVEFCAPKLFFFFFILIYGVI